MKDFLQIGYEELCILTSDAISNRIKEKALIVQAHEYKDLSLRAKLVAIKNNRYINVKDGLWKDDIESDAETMEINIYTFKFNPLDIDIGVTSDFMEICNLIFKRHIEESPLYQVALKHLTQDTACESLSDKQKVYDSFCNNIKDFYINQLSDLYIKLTSLKQISKSIISQNLLFNADGTKFKQ